MSGSQNFQLDRICEVLLCVLPNIIFSPNELFNTNIKLTIHMFRGGYIKDFARAIYFVSLSVVEQCFFLLLFGLLGQINGKFFLFFFLGGGHENIRLCLAVKYMHPSVQ